MRQSGPYGESGELCVALEGRNCQEPDRGSGLSLVAGVQGKPPPVVGDF